MLHEARSNDYDPTDRMQALQLLHETAAPRRVRHRTCIYIEPDKDDFCSLLNLVDEPLALLPPTGRVRRERCSTS